MSHMGVCGILFVLAKLRIFLTITGRIGKIGIGL